MRLTRIFLESDLRSQFEGLRKIAREARTDLAGATVLFMNKKRTAFKMITQDAYLVYFKSNRIIPLDAIRHLPEHFGGTELEMNRAIARSLEEQLGPPTQS